MDNLCSEITYYFEPMFLPGWLKYPLVEYLHPLTNDFLVLGLRACIRGLRLELGSTGIWSLKRGGVSRSAQKNLTIWKNLIKKGSDLKS